MTFMKIRINWDCLTLGPRMANVFVVSKLYYGP